MIFEEIRDQEAAVATLVRAIGSDKLAHAYLFEGPGGVGKRTTALALAQALNCLEAPGVGCLRCDSCRKIRERLHPDVIVVGPPEGKKQTPIESIRELERRVAYRPNEGRAQVAIIDPAHVMTEAAANALLKTLEEPRPDTFLILVTDRAPVLLPTVRSRCQRVRFRPLARATVEGLLVAGGTPPPTAAIAASLADGSLDKAARYLGEELQERLDRAFALLQAVDDPLPLGGLDTAQACKERDEALALFDLLVVVAGELTDRLARRDDPPGPLARQLAGPLANLLERPVARQAARLALLAEGATLAIERNNMNPQLAVEGVFLSMRGRAAHLFGTRA